ncbi:MAG TPA: formimidoylglutamate deiminase [Candidatus Elarobacter sp.]|jgi:formimidoylglutamate deiminase|nr:formimidoylglutamate deiminase [Candidatus Elarobacter sp.]
MRIFAREAFLPDGWAPDVALEIAPDGTITGVYPGAAPSGAEILDGPVVAGMPNLHSHAFQRMMAGSAERRGSGEDDFWTWRGAMYELAASLQPDALHGIALDVYRRMLRAGYTAVAEFHYLHRDPRGRWYADKAATSRALIAAAKEAGIAICLLPALYAHGDAGGAPLHERQRRFATTPDDVLEIAAMLRADHANDADVVIGTCAHSLRAVTRDELRALLDGAPRDVPVHLHAAEQAREVDAVRAAYGARPVAWLLANCEVDTRWCLVHATQLEDAERDALARSGAVAGLCPTTEANLGDGLFPLAPYLASDGALGIGSDGNLSISPAEELRWLEYGQRLAMRRRIVAATEPGASCGETLYARAARGGARACGFAAGALEPGRRADLLVLDDRDLPLAGAPPGELLDRWLFAAERPAPRHVMVRGRWRVRDGEPAA